MRSPSDQGACRVSRSVKPAVPSPFWRDAALPFIEARTVDDGRAICYAKHTHDTFSLGAIVGGTSTYLNGATKERIGRGALVIIDPEQVHACNPYGPQAWAYRMVYVDVPWLGRLQHALGRDPNTDFHGFSQKLTDQRDLFAHFGRFYRTLMSPGIDVLGKESAAVEFFTQLHRTLGAAAMHTRHAADNAKLARAADYIAAHCRGVVTLDEICAAADLSPSYLIRAFNARYGMTPHAYLIDRCVQYGRAELRRGRPIADVALDAGFADQAHFQRAFRRIAAATPGQYRGGAR
jgi:AraC-like DNA-binding protein